MARKSGPTGAAFLLAQVGAHAGSAFSARLSESGLTPPQAGMLRLLRDGQDLSQQDLARSLGIPASRVVAFVDDLEDHGYMRRERSQQDRRQNVLRLTEAGQDALHTIGSVAQGHEDELLKALDKTERRQLTELLGRVAYDQNLTPGVHPGYKTTKPNTKEAPTSAGD